MTRAEKMIAYCRRDTEITGKFVKSMLKTYEDIGCEFKTTIAATTLGFFEQRFLGAKLRHSFSEEQIDFFHRGYYGGRTEIFFNRPCEGRIWYHDINSLYPSTMRDGKFPVLEHFYETKKPDIENCEGMAEVQIQAPQSLSIPYLPCKSESKLLFGLGEWWGVYTFFELREAQRLGYRVLKFGRAVEFPYRSNPFSEFISTIYERRLEAQKNGDELMSLVYKAFGNFAYGKYAQRNETTELVPLSRLKKIPTGTVILGGDLAFIQRKKDYPRYANCIWACYVTAYARHRLYQALRHVENSGGLLLYCDTDSVIYENKTNLIPHSTALGEFKLEGRFRYAHFKLPKLYCLKPYERRKRTTYKAKGVPHKVAKNFFQNGKAKYKKPNKLRESLRRNLSPGRIYDLIPNFWETREKEIRGKYTKRQVLKSGHTIPCVLTLEGNNGKKQQKGGRRPDDKTRSR